MVLTLTLNPAIDHHILADRLVFEDRAYVLAQSDSPGGRGVIASRVLHAFGAKTAAISAAGGKNGAKFAKVLSCCDFPAVIVPIRSEIRNNLTITDKHGLTIKLNEPGLPMADDEVAAVEQAVEERLEKADWLMLCGSIPPGVDPRFYCKLIKRAREHGVKTLLDADGDPLQYGVEEGPTVVSPNHQEAERLLNRALITRAHFMEAVARIQVMGAECVLLSLGSRGVVAIDKHQMIEAVPPRIEALSPIGSGDALAAAFVWASTKKKSFTECVRWAVAAGTASAKLPGTDFASLEQTKEMYKLIEVRPAH
ncbi:MAG: 1-phosphofructokinase family hexose kinase [Acidobacteriota bacterium]|nr:1-phosphofructokinase family hexose kinase [Acidobacteriota bacterium]